MSTTPERTRRVHRTTVQTRFSDTDALGHINNAVFATYAEIARLDFLSALGGTVRSLILANLNIDFRRQMLIGDEIHVESWVAKIGNSSFNVDQTIIANGERAADIASVVVHFDYAAGKPSPIPADIREKLSGYRIAG